MIIEKVEDDLPDTPFNPTKVTTSIVYLIFNLQSLNNQKPNSNIFADFISPSTDSPLKLWKVTGTVTDEDYLSQNKREILLLKPILPSSNSFLQENRFHFE